MFKIDFDKAFSMMDSDHITAIRVEGNYLYITFHTRAKVVSYYGWDKPHIEKAFDTTYGYIFGDNVKLEEMYRSLTSNNSEKIKKIYEEFVKERKNAESVFNNVMEG